MEFVLQTNALTKIYGKQKAVNAVNMHLRQGEIYGFIGKNGSGKTTFMKMISGMAHPTSGEITLFGCTGQEILRQKVLSRIGTLIEAPGLYPGMTAYENLRLKCIAYGIGDTQKYCQELLELVGLADVGKKKVGGFSLGMRQRLGIAMALVGEPDLLVLDEPTNGLDPQGIADMRHILQRLNAERKLTILISSHILEELSKVVTCYGIINEGQLLAELTQQELQEKCRDRICITTDRTDLASVALEEMQIGSYQVMDPRTIHVFERYEDICEINRRLVLAEVPVAGIVLENTSVEEYYFALTGGGNEHA